MDGPAPALPGDLPPAVPGAPAAAPTPDDPASLLRLLADHLPALVAYYDAPAGRCRFANRGYAEAFGRTPESILGLTAEEVMGAEPAARVRSHVEQALHGRERVAYERELDTAEGHRHVEVELLPHLQGERVLGMLVLVSDHTRHRLAEAAARESEARIHHLAHHDTLTGLPNRTAFMELLDHRMAAAQETQSLMALLFIDLDHFQRVNDSLGHLVGDTLLRTTASRITASLRTTDVVARFGGDEFMVLLPQVAHREVVEQVAQKVLKAIEAPVHAEGRPLSVTASVGAAMFPDDGTRPETLIKHADTAMYLAKARGRAQVRFFDPAMASTAYAALVMEGELTQALERGEFELWFQPQVSARTDEVVGAEALIRWRHPTRGLLQPGAFIPVAEQRRLMLPLGQWVLREAVRCAGRWHARGLGLAPVAINLSTMQFQVPQFADLVADVLREEGVDGALVELELTERMLLDDLPEVGAKLRRLAALGIRVSVDDFGTGYSSLGHLKTLPIDKMKIDASFVHDLPDHPGSAAITRAIIQMARSLGITAIAEGVETQAQRDFLVHNGCDELQGTLVSVPLPAGDIERWAEQRRAARGAGEATAS